MNGRHASGEPSGWHHGGMEVRETLLPGVGVRYEFETAAGGHLGLITRRDGQVDVVVYDAADPDICTEVATLTSAEAETVAEILGAPRIAERLADLSREVPGLHSRRFEIPAASPFAGAPLGSTRARTRTGASVVAVVRDTEVIASPTPSHVLLAGDVLVAIGTVEGLDALRELLLRS